MSENAKNVENRYRYLILSDLYRYTGSVRFKTLLKYIFISGTSFKYIFWLRIAFFSRTNFFLKILVYPFARLILHHLKYRLGISMYPQTKIGSGFYIGHFCGIFISAECVIGKNCNVSQGVTIGRSNRGKYKGFPVIGDNVFIGPGAKIIGAIEIGNNVAIGANSVITKNIPNNAVVVGIPGKIISYNGSGAYVEFTDYDDKIIL